MDPLVLVDEVVKDYWKDEIGNYLSDSDYDCFYEDVVSGRAYLLSEKEVLEKLPLPSQADEGERPVCEFFDFEKLFWNIAPYDDCALETDLLTHPVRDGIEDLRGTSKNTEWKEIVCDLSFFDAGKVRSTNDDFEHEFYFEFSDLIIYITNELKYPTKPLVEYTHDPAKKIWEKTTVDGVPLFEFLGI